MDYPTPLLIEGNWLFYAIAVVLSLFVVYVVIKAVVMASRFLVGLHMRARARQEAEQQAQRAGRGGI